MSDLPERIWAFARVKMTDGTWYGDWHSNETELFTEFVRADLAPVIGYSREQMLEAMKQSDFESFFTREENEEYLATLTPASSVPVPTVDELYDILVHGAIYPSGLAMNCMDMAKLINNALLTKGRGGA
jgi:hypothetical protein